MKRPWKGRMEAAQEDDISVFDAKNPLCPGALRPNGVVWSAVLCYNATVMFFFKLSTENCK